MPLGDVAPALIVPLPPWAQDPAITHIVSLTEGRFVGGVVRDLLLGRIGMTDIDIATPLRPDEIMRRLGAAEIRTIPTGISHGTVTALADTRNGSRALEITTLRRDVETDGRHAVVAYTDDWRADAARRDFTMNALYLDGDGGIWDFFGGLEDCHAGHVRFVGEPLLRLEEDVLRSLRFYRFLAHFGRVAPDLAARDACRTIAPKLSRLSGERVRVEMLKLLSAPQPVPAFTMMVDDDVWTGLFPKLEPRPNVLARLVLLEPEPDALRRLAAVLPPGSGAKISDRLKFSTLDRDRLSKLVDHRDEGGSVDEDKRRGQRVAIYRLGRALYRDLVVLNSAVKNRLDHGRVLLDRSADWTAPVFPLRGADLIDAGVAPGPEIGRKLAAAEDWWISGDFSADRAACLAFALRS